MSVKSVAWTAAIALVVVLAHDRAKGGGLPALRVGA